MIIEGDCRDALKTLGDGAVQCVVTSPPYWGLRDYGVNGQIGLEETPEEYVTNLAEIFSEVKRVLRDDGTLWLNLGDSYAANGISGLDVQGATSTVGKANPRSHQKKTVPLGLKPKDLVGIPWRVAFALQADGWYLRSDIIWHKPNPMPESVTDRPTKSHEYVFLLSKSERYYYDADAIREPQTCEDKRAGRNSQCLIDRSPIPRKGIRSSDPERFGLTRGKTNESCTHPAGRNKRTVWTIATQPYKEAHFATFPEELPKLCILAGSKPGDTVFDPFSGSGTVGKVATELGREFVGIELNPAYIKMAEIRTNTTKGML